MDREKLIEMVEARIDGAEFYCPPYLPLYTGDWIAGTADLTFEEAGIYIRLLALSWRKGFVTEHMTDGLPNCTRLLAEKFIEVRSGYWANERLESARESMRKRSESGSKGGRQRQANAQGKLKGSSREDQAADQPSVSVSVSKTDQTGQSQFGHESGQIFEPLEYGRQVLRVMPLPSHANERRLIAAMAILASTQLSESWLADALGGVTSTENPRKPYALLRGCARAAAERKHGADFDQLEKGLDIPRAFYKQLGQLVSEREPRATLRSADES